jgi:uncharacterized protein
VILLDANILLYTHNAKSSHHLESKKWMERAMERQEEVGLAWITILAFLRIATNPAVYSAPLSVKEATEIMAEYLSRSHVFTVQPTSEHWEILSSLVRETQSNRHLVSDAHLAALAIEHNAAICTNDRDFQRFKGIKIVDPFRKI